MITATIAKRVKDRRKEIGMGRAELARRAKLSPQAIWLIEENLVKSPGILTIAAIAKGLEVTLISLLE